MYGVVRWETYQCLAVEAVLAGGYQALQHGEGVGVQGNVAVYAEARGMLQPQAAVDDVAQVRVHAGRPVGVVVGKGQAEHVAGAHQMAAIALDQAMQAARGEGEHVQGVPQGVEVEDVGGPAVGVGEGGQILAVLDLELRLAGEVVGALDFSEAWQARARVDEVREDLVDDLDGERLHGTLAGAAPCACACACACACTWAGGGTCACGFAWAWGDLAVVCIYTRPLLEARGLWVVLIARRLQTTLARLTQRLRLGVRLHGLVVTGQPAVSATTLG